MFIYVKVSILLILVILWYCYMLDSRVRFCYTHVDMYGFVRRWTPVEFDTITAISTPMGEGAIAIVRLSGSSAIAIANKIFRSPNGKDLFEQSSHTIHYGHLVDPKTDEVVEEVMLSLMKGPKTFTREDVIEINCHGD